MMITEKEFKKLDKQLDKDLKDHIEETNKKRELKEIEKAVKESQELAKKTEIELPKLIEEAKKEEPEFTPQEWMSPSSINTHDKCPRKYFYNYIAKIRTGGSIHLTKGTIVHTTLENFFRGYKKNPRDFIIKTFEKAWSSQEKSLKRLELSEKDLKSAYNDCLNIVNEYYESHSRKIKMLIQAGKAENEQHAYYLVKPKFKELYVKSESLKVRGYIDRVHEDFDGILTLGDYKTSNKYGIGLPEDYKRQMAIYSLLYQEQENRIADFVSVIFLRFGETYLLEVTPSLLKYALTSINAAYRNTRSVDIGDYPLKESNLCRWCDYQQICNGKDDWEAEARKCKLHAMLKKEKKKKKKDESVKNEKI